MSDDDLTATSPTAIPTTIQTYPQFALMTLHNTYMTYSIPRVKTANPEAKSTLPASQFRPSKNPRHLEPFLPIDPLYPQYDELKLNLFYSNDGQSGNQLAGTSPHDPNGLTKYMGNSGLANLNGGGLDLEQHKVLDPIQGVTEGITRTTTTTTTTTTSSPSTPLSPAPSQVPTAGTNSDNVYQNDNGYFTLNRAKLVPQGLLRLIPRIQEPEVARYPSYQISTDHNHSNARRVDIHQQQQQSDEGNDNDNMAMEDGDVVQKDQKDDAVQNVPHKPQDSVWISGICYNAALLKLPHTNGVPAWVTDANTPNKK